MPDVLVFLIVLAILVLVVAVVSAPLRRPRASGVEPEPARAREGSDGEGTAAEVGELEAARDAKYREIRDAELDRETGKLSQADFEAIDQTLRTEAIEILNALEGVRGEVDGTPRYEDRPPEPDRRRPD